MNYDLQNDYEPMDRFNKWDEQTREMLSRRLANEIGHELSFRFFDTAEGVLLQRIADVLTAQPLGGDRIKFAEIIDARLAGQRRGVRYGDDAWPDEYYKMGLAEFIRQLDFEGSSDTSDETKQLELFIAKKLEQEAADSLVAFLRTVLKDSVEILYSHPAAWKEVGFPGPAYPEGYPYLKCDKKEGWEPDYVQS